MNVARNALTGPIRPEPGAEAGAFHPQGSRASAQWLPLPIFFRILAVALFSLAGNNAYGQLAPNPTSIKFGLVELGNQSSKNVYVKNTGTSSVTVSQATVTGAAFSISGLSLPVTLKPGARSEFTATFSPTVAGKVLGNISLTSNAPGSPTVISLTGTGNSLLLSVTPTSTNFGNVTVGNNSSLPVLLNNTGSGSVTISQSILTGTGFSLSGLTLPLTLKPGKNASFDVTFSPTSTGNYTGSVSIISNASNSPGISSLSGVGTVPPSVTLTWNASTSQNIAGYEVYRSQVSGGPYTLLNSTLDTLTSYTDMAVQSGGTYYYVNTAVDSSGLQSTYSNQAEATIP
jgi:hypothetical protein